MPSSRPAIGARGDAAPRRSTSPISSCSISACPTATGSSWSPRCAASRDRGLIIVSAREETEQKVAALDLGADDYVTKPFDTEELLARIRAALRQRLASRGGAADRRCRRRSAIDLVARSVRRGGEEVHLTPKEYAVLAELAKHPGRVFTHEQLLRAVWGPAQERQTEYLRVVDAQPAPEAGGRSVAARG